jgi:DNA polymerase I-like protein with 3'-5' exonuclease and polymerase domains
MIMSHAFKSDNKHGLKDLAILYLDYPDDDEEALGKVVKSLRLKAKKYGWTIYNKDNPHESLKGTLRTGWKTDYWLPYEYAAFNNYDLDHEYYSICDKYAENDAERTYGLYLVFNEMMTANQKIAYNESRQLIEPILDMQYQGIPVKEDALKAAKDKYSKRYIKTLQELRTLADSPKFNPKSHIQLGEILFNKFGFPKIADMSTNKNVLSKLLADCPAKNRPRKYRFLLTLMQLRKISTTLQYVTNYDTHAIIRTPLSSRGYTPPPDNKITKAHKGPKSSNKVTKAHTLPFRKERYHDTNRVIQPFFKQWHTGTTRLSCEAPNTTNVGKDTDNPFTKMPELGIEQETSFKLREVFGPTEGDQWTCIDFDQFQLRIFAVVSNSTTLLRAFENGEDAHHAVARVLFKSDNISDVQRTAAKAINFGILFGAGPAKIELIAGMPGLYNTFTSRFPNAKVYLDQQERLARTKGYVHTLNGYRLYVPRDATYAASCYVIQGTEAQIVRKAMIRTNRYIKQSQQAARSMRSITKKCPYKLLMMVHDELVFTAPQGIHQPHLSEIMKIMEDCGNRIGVPCKVDAKITTTTWADRVAA